MCLAQSRLHGTVPGFVDVVGKFPKPRDDGPGPGDSAVQTHRRRACKPCTKGWLKEEFRGLTGDSFAASYVVILLADILCYMWTGFIAARYQKKNFSRAS